MEDVELAREFKEIKTKIIAELRKVIVGQDTVIENLLISLFSNGHSLMVGVPGLAKTMLVGALARVMDFKFNRIQFTPDLMPSDITGTDILHEDQTTGQRSFRFIKGPIFSNIILADEINRTPPKTQAALLQAMQEKQVTVGNDTYELEAPFLVFATQNPIEHEGTYPLPEAQLDRFMFHINVDYPDRKQEVNIALMTTSAFEVNLKKVLDREKVLAFQKLIPRVPASEFVAGYAVDLVQASRPLNGSSPDFVNEWVNWGAGPRASQFLILAAKTKALLDNRTCVNTEDIRNVAKQVLEHRLILNFKAEAENIKASEIIDRLIKTVKEK